MREKGYENCNRLGRIKKQRGGRGGGKLEENRQLYKAGKGKEAKERKKSWRRIIGRQGIREL